MKPGAWTRRARAALFLVVAVAVNAQVQQSLEDGVAAYEQGDYATAFQILKPLAEQGDANAQINLGLIYRWGQGVPQDYGEAAKWWRKAAEQGHADVQVSLGTMYYFGLGVLQDYGQAHMWFNLAAASLPPGEDHNQAVSSRTFTEGKMTPAQVAEAQRLAREWKPK